MYEFLFEMHGFYQSQKTKITLNSIKRGGDVQKEFRKFFDFFKDSRILPNAVCSRS